MHSRARAQQSLGSLECRRQPMSGLRHQARCERLQQRAHGRHVGRERSDGVRLAGKDDETHTGIPGSRKDVRHRVSRARRPIRVHVRRGHRRREVHHDHPSARQPKRGAFEPLPGRTREREHGDRPGDRKPGNRGTARAGRVEAEAGLQRRLHQLRPARATPPAPADEAGGEQHDRQRDEPRGMQEMKGFEAPQDHAGLPIQAAGMLSSKASASGHTNHSDAGRSHCLRPGAGARRSICR